MDTRPKSVSKEKCAMKLAPVSVNSRTVHVIVPPVDLSSFSGNLSG